MVVYPTWALGFFFRRVTLIMFLFIEGYNFDDDRSGV